MLIMNKCLKINVYYYISMNTKEKNEVEVQKILEKLFTYADNKDLNINRIRNLIVNPEILRVLIHHLNQMSNEDKINIIARVAEIYSSNSLNCCILSKRDRQILEFNHSIFDQIVTFAFSIKLEFKQNLAFFEKIKPIISKYPIGCRNIKNITSKISKNFHLQNFNPQKLQLCLFLLKELFKTQSISNTEPKCFFYIYGPNSGIRLINQDLKWTLAKGMYVYLNFFMESYQHEQMNLLHIIVNNDSFQLCIDEQNYLTVKVFQGSKINRLRKISQKTWYFLKLSYCLKTGIIRNTFELVVHIQGQPYEIRDLPVPNTNIQSNIDELIIGSEFYGKINVAAISRKQIKYWPKNGINSWSQIQGLLSSNKDNIKQIFLFYSPIINTRLNETEVIFEISSKNHGQILENTSIYNNPFDEVDINYYGGLYTLIPFFYILKFYPYGVYYSALQDMFDLILLLFKSDYQNIENQAVNCQLFGIIAQFMNQVDERYITIHTIELITQFKDYIQTKLLRKLFLQFLLKIRIQRIQNLKAIEKIHRLIASFYHKDFTWALQSVSLYEIIWYIIDNFEPSKKQDCCLLHCWELSPEGLDDQKIFSIEEHYKTKCNQIKDLLKFIIRNLCKNKKYDLLLQKQTQGEETVPNLLKPKDKFSIFQYLKYDGYSICLKKLLLQCIQCGIQQDPNTLIKQTQLLNCLYGLLSTAQLKDQLVPIIRLLSECFKVLTVVKDPKSLQIIRQIGAQLDKMYMKKCSSIRLRSISQGIQIKKKLSQRKVSNEMEDTLSFTSDVKEQDRQKEKDIKNKIIKLRNQKKIKISNDKELYDLLIGICCTKQVQGGDLMLADDEFTQIINPYFKICCSKYRVKLIEMIRTTIIVKFQKENIPMKMQSLSKFDKICRFVLSEFILKELDPLNPDYQPSQETNYIIKNFFFIIDHMVQSMKNDWDSLYLLILRLIGVLTEAKKQIHQKTQISKKDILLACKVCVRKFLLRVVKFAEKSIENMGNMVFLVYLVVFNNPESVQLESEHLFHYFKNLQSNFFIGPIAIKNQDDHQNLYKNIFVDQKIILSYLDGFKMQQVFNKQHIEPSKKKRYIINLIQVYLDREQSNELQDYLFKLRKVFLSKSHFKEITNDNKGIRKMISKFMIGVEEIKSREASYDIHVGQIIGLLLCLTLQASINTNRVQILKQSLHKCVLFVKAFSLACSRDNLRKKQHSMRDQMIPKRTVYHLIHFLYQMIENLDEQKQKQKEMRNQLIQSLHQIITFLTILMNVLCQKVGNPNSLEDIQILSNVMQDVQQYNFFSFQVFKGIMILSEIRLYSSIPKSKALDVLQNHKMKQHFKVQPQVFLEKHVKQTVEIHRLNIQKIQLELEEKFKKIQYKNKEHDLENVSLQNQFEQYRLDHARKLDIQYRFMMKVWRKIWKRLRLYHYYWSISMDQREQIKLEWKKAKYLPYKHKFGKYTDLDGLRPILEVEPNEPWHVRKSQIEQQVKYRNKNFMINLYKLKSSKNIRQKSIMDFFMRKSNPEEYFQVLWIKHNSKRKGRISLTKQKIIFHYQSTFQKDSHVDFTSFTLAQHRTIEKTWNLVNISNIIRRRYLMRSECLLIQFQDSSCLILDFINDDLDLFFSRIQDIQSQKSQMSNFMKANKISFYLKKFRKNNYKQQIEQATDNWCEGKITNLQYMMILNKYSGRSYLDPVNYPVMPWVVGNYDIKEFVYRDLSKTLGSLGDSKRREFYQSKVQTVDPFSSVPPYQYGTHYSSPGVLFNFLIRISPYTQAARTLQGGRFDLSDRLFSSIKICWHSVRNEVSDVRQLNPQFFYLPEFLINIQNHDFGLTQLKQRVDNVKLPVWSNNAYQFITMHRRAFQSDQVSTHLQYWIDLIFGYKQKGKIARQNLNLYYYLTYQDSIDLKKIQDPVQRTSIEAQIIHFGQTPSQIFMKPHPQKKFLKGSKPFSQPQKVKFLGLIESTSPIQLLGQGQNQNHFLIFNQSSLITVQMHTKFDIKSEISLLRNTSKEGMYFVEDLSVNGKIILFGNNKYIAVSSYVNGDLVIFSISGKKIYRKRSTPKSIIFVNKKQNLLLCGCKNGLLQVYEIVYSQKQSVNLIKIASEYYMFPIEHISEGAGFFSISSGNLVVINKITRGLNYVHDKFKMQGTKMIRSLQSKRKIYGSFIFSNPIYCVVLFNSLQIYIYSINGQFLKLRQVENTINPIIMVDYMNRQNVIALQPSGLLVLKVPELETVCSIPLPHKEFIDMKIIKDKLYLITNNGEILYLFNQKEVMFY